jgi:hypothetical protein
MTASPDRHKHAIYQKVLPTEDMLQGLMNDALLDFAPGLYDVLTGDAPPSIEFLKNLPQDATSDMWAAYALVLTKDGALTKAYFGSGTRTVGGAAARFKNYDDEAVLPVHVAKALADGYEIVSKGLLVTSTHPLATSPYVRCLFLAMEATFTFCFNAMLPWKNLGMDLREVCPWPLDQFEYEGLNSHNPMIETPAGFAPTHVVPRPELQVRGIDLSPGEQAAAIAEYERRRKEYHRLYMADYRARLRAADPEGFRKTNAAISLARHARQRVTDPDYYLKKREDRRLYFLRHPERVAATERKSRDKAKEEGRHPCKPCNMTFYTSTQLRNHEGRPIHQIGVDKAAGTYKGKNWDMYCNREWPHTSTYKAHLDSKTHKNAIEAYNMKASAATAFAAFQPLKKRKLDDAAPPE